VEKKTAILFATDIASRGIDFPAVDWVVQVDCPENINTYIHRVGRTARYKSKGNALLMLLPSEEKFAERLKQRSIQLKKLQSRADKQLTIAPVLEKMNAENKELQYLAKRACASYLRGVHVMKDKEVFQIDKIDTVKLAASYGLLNAPQIRIIKKEDVDGEPKEKESQKDRILRLRMQSKEAKMKKQMAAQVNQTDSDEAQNEIESDDDDFLKPKKE